MRLWWLCSWIIGTTRVECVWRFCELKRKQSGSMNIQREIQFVYLDISFSLTWLCKWYEFQIIVNSLLHWCKAVLGLEEGKQKWQSVQIYLICNNSCATLTKVCLFMNLQKTSNVSGFHIKTLWHFFNFFSKIRCYPLLQVLL
jgi:hypothetical protein